LLFLIGFGPFLKSSLALATDNENNEVSMELMKMMKTPLWIFGIFYASKEGNIG